LRTYLQNRAAKAIWPHPLSEKYTNAFFGFSLQRKKRTQYENKADLFHSVLSVEILPQTITAII
jgi:hypothetical protein